MEKWTSLAVQAVITIAAIFMFIYSAQSGFYWYNGGIHYVGMHGFGLVDVVCGNLPGESRRQNCDRSVIHCIGSACHDYGGKQFRHGIAGIIVVCLTILSGQRGSGTAQDGAVAAACLHWCIS